MCKQTITIRSNIKNYQAIFCEDAGFIASLAAIDSAIFFVDSRVFDIYKDSILSPIVGRQIIMLEIDEEHKNIDYVCELYQKLMQFSPKKNVHIVSIGGGITQDITGFIASSLYRGVRWSFVPTTLLAQTDSCIGAKTSLNFLGYKNLIGTFYPPDTIYIYAPFCSTLSPLDMHSGMGEMAKFHLLCGKKRALDFAQILPELLSNSTKLMETIATCLEIKRSYIEEDEFDTGKRNLLNFGHCFGHALESSTNFAIPHGLAVVIGILLANRVARKRGLLADDEESYIARNILYPLLSSLDLPKLDSNMTLQAMAKDKKNIASNNLLPLVMLADSAPPPPVWRRGGFVA